MGRPKVLRNRDVVKSVDTKKAGTKITFGDADETDVAYQVEETVVERRSNVSSTNDSSPEEVKNDNEEILSLKRLHEQMIDPTKRKPKRKAVKVSDEADAELDPSILSSLDDITAAETDDTVVPSSSGVTAPGKIDKSKTNSKKFGNIVVSVLPDEYVDPIASFKVHKSVLEFQAANNNHERIKYSAFAAQKRGKVSRSFLVK